MGRPPKPVEQKLREGNPGRRPLPAPQVVIPGQLAIPESPEGLDEAGLQFWADVWSVGLAWLSPQLDRAIVETAARTFDECARYRQIVRAAPLLKEPVTTASGNVVGERFVPNPAEQLLRRAEKQLERWLMALALPPTARARLGLIQVVAASKLDEMIRSGIRNDDLIEAEVVDT